MTPFRNLTDVTLIVLLSSLPSRDFPSENFRFRQRREERLPLARPTFLFEKKMLSEGKGPLEISRTDMYPLLTLIFRDANRDLYLLDTVRARVARLAIAVVLRAHYSRCNLSDRNISNKITSLRLFPSSFPFL